MDRGGAVWSWSLVPHISGAVVVWVCFSCAIVNGRSYGNMSLLCSVHIMSTNNMRPMTSLSVRCQIGCRFHMR